MKIVLHPACQGAGPTREPLIFVCDCVLILRPPCKLNWEVRDGGETEMWNKAMCFIKLYVCISLWGYYTEWHIQIEAKYIRCNTQLNEQINVLEDVKSEPIL